MNVFFSSFALRNQLPRIITGLALAAALVVCLVAGGVWLAAALALVSGIALFEFFQMFWPGKTKLCSKIFGIGLGLMIFCPVGGDQAGFTLLSLAFVWTGLAFLLDYGRGNDGARLERYAALPLGLLYIPVILHLALSLSVREQFLVVVAAISSDIAAYYAGSAFGRHKIWPRVSPKKSWEGGIAGFFVGVVATMCVACLPYGGEAPLGGNWALWFFAAAFLTMAAQVGDFFESALKRARNIKDSSAILPGHGGVLDRIDSILFVLAAYGVIRLAADHATRLSKFFAA